MVPRVRDAFCRWRAGGEKRGKATTSQPTVRPSLPAHQERFVQGPLRQLVGRDPENINVPVHQGASSRQSPSSVARDPCLGPLMAGRSRVPLPVKVLACPPKQVGHLD